MCEAGVKEEIVAVLRGAAANKEGELCVQAIFLLLDVLKKWAEDAKGTAAFSASGTLFYSKDQSPKSDFCHSGAAQHSTRVHQVFLGSLSRFSSSLHVLALVLFSFSSRYQLVSPAMTSQEPLYTLLIPSGTSSADTPLTNPMTSPMLTST